MQNSNVCAECDLRCLPSYCLYGGNFLSIYFNFNILTQKFNS